ncbi:hypothetical protein LR48_Vigan01g117400 [Vigna angularis]|uniref:Uncharacterized protein n=1 Tax=Phaseolus angularis TaxID=3914 RepID=A0A0L9TN77_PHAAN|nr:hypothetical protein LR48_Vigan01g117400 [Vigna angularis]
MAIVDVESSLESSSRGSGGATGSGSRPSSPDSMSSSYLERSDGDDDSRPPSPIHSREEEPEPQSPIYITKRVVNGEVIHLLKGGIDIDDVGPVSVDCLPVVRGYDWASHGVSLYISEYGTKRQLKWWMDRLWIARDIEDARLMRLGVSRGNERVFHGKESSADDFFFVYTYLFDQLFVRVPFTPFQSAVLRELNCFDVNLAKFLSPFEASCRSLFPANPASCPHGNRRAEPPRPAELPSQLPLATVAATSRSSATIATTIGVVEVTQLQPQAHPSPMIILEQSSEATTPFVVPLERKRKAHKEGENNQHHVGAVNRASMLAWYLCDFYDRRRTEHVQGELAAERKVSTDLRAEVEALRAAHKGCEKKQGKEIGALNDSVMYEHEEGFNKALRQASFLLGVTDPFVAGFDIEKDVIDGELVQLEEGEPVGEEILAAERQPGEEEKPVGDNDDVDGE